MWERWTERARQVVVFAQEEAREFKHDYLGVEHLFLGLIQEGEGLAARVIGQLGITLEQTREFVVRETKIRTDYKKPAQLSFTPRAKNVIERTLRESLLLSHNYVGTEHILLAIAQESEGTVARFLTDKLGDNFSDQIADTVLEQLLGPQQKKELATPKVLFSFPVKESIHADQNDLNRDLIAAVNQLNERLRHVEDFLHNYFKKFVAER